jgi:hypothetical protein
LVSCFGQATAENAKWYLIAVMLEDLWEREGIVFGQRVAFSLLAQTLEQRLHRGALEVEHPAYAVGRGFVNASSAFHGSLVFWGIVDAVGQAALECGQIEVWDREAADDAYDRAVRGDDLRYKTGSPMVAQVTAAQLRDVEKGLSRESIAEVVREAIRARAVNGGIASGKNATEAANWRSSLSPDEEEAAMLAAKQQYSFKSGNRGPVSERKKGGHKKLLPSERAACMALGSRDGLAFALAALTTYLRDDGSCDDSEVRDDESPEQRNLRRVVWLEMDRLKKRQWGGAEAVTEATAALEVAQEEGESRFC